MTNLYDSEYLNGFNDNFLRKLTGRYYTNELVARQGIRNLVMNILATSFSKTKMRIIDPFCGDGRLVYWFLEEWANMKGPEIEWEVQLWDINAESLSVARNKMTCLKAVNHKIDYILLNKDAFEMALKNKDAFDVIVTNPPWELLKPDTRELTSMDNEQKKKHIDILKGYDTWLANNYPNAQPLKKFAGWGTNLSRVGLDASDLMCVKSGWVMILLPASFFADEQSKLLRASILGTNDVLCIAYYPAEAKLFGTADTSSSILIYTKNYNKGLDTRFCIYDKDLAVVSDEIINIKYVFAESTDFNLPINLGFSGMKIIERMKAHLPTWGFLEAQEGEALWAGREIDETNIDNFLSEEEGIKFLKGRMIDRFKTLHAPSKTYTKANWIAPFSTSVSKIVWRDVSRPSQKRRLIATLVPPGIVAGNSLGVACYHDNDQDDLKILLAIMNSLCFEFQLRTYLATGHISLSAIRKVYMPSRTDFAHYTDILIVVNAILENENADAIWLIEAMVAKHLYKLNIEDFKVILNSFKGLTTQEKKYMVEHFNQLDIVGNNPKKELANTPIKIHNHYTSKLSELDLLVVKSVPPGGNWKNLPSDLPSNRVKQIRESFALGKGSRSTYYGRLLPDKPSYTINTYFNRPGNGCHIHYNQERVLSQREAARLQSFPDNFIFYGSQSSINNQIGNAVPPLLAYQIAQNISATIGHKGIYIDLFSGAGGLGLGFRWAGWQSIVANDINASYLESYAKNVHAHTVVGSITNIDVFNSLVQIAKDAKANYPNKPLWILGGPPCQGFSTAGNKRTMEDERNTLFIQYMEFLEAVQPDGFVFENVSGLLSMEKGKIFEEIQTSFKLVMPNLTGFVLDAEKYAVPQRRKRVFLIGQKSMQHTINSPKQLSALEESNNLFGSYHKCISVEEALSDLPVLKHSQDGSHFDYRHEPRTLYQSFMRGQVSVKEYLDSIKKQDLEFA